MDKAWKADERYWAKRYGTGKRILDQPRGGGPDFLFRGDVLPNKRGECKRRKKLPAWMRDALEKSDVTVIQEAYQPRDKAYILMRVTTFDELLGGTDG